MGSRAGERKGQHLLFEVLGWLLTDLRSTGVLLQDLDYWEEPAGTWKIVWVGGPSATDLADRIGSVIDPKVALSTASGMPHTDRALTWSLQDR